jgi:drug/metabolite transporter (DMT)-like permease
MTRLARTPPHALAGIAFLVAAVACFAVLDTTTKFISLSVPVLMALWFRYAFQAIATTMAVLPSRGWGPAAHRASEVPVPARRAAAHDQRFGVLQPEVHAGGRVFTAIIMITPLVITLLASLTLGERVSVLRWAAWLAVRESRIFVQATESLRGRPWPSFLKFIPTIPTHA